MGGEISPTTLQAAVYSAAKITGCDEKKVGDESWKKVNDCLTEESVNNCFFFKDHVKGLFAKGGVEFTSMREAPKSFKRIEQKLSNTTKTNWHTKEKFNDYSFVSRDLLGARILLNDFNQLQETLNKINNVVKNNGGVAFTRGFTNNDGEIKTLAVYVWTVIKTAEGRGVPLEVQILHPYADKTFQIDSALRDFRNTYVYKGTLIARCGKNASKEEKAKAKNELELEWFAQGRMPRDLWSTDSTGNDLYMTVQAEILAKANGKPSTGVNLLAASDHAHGGAGKTPADQKTILQSV